MAVLPGKVVGGEAIRNGKALTNIATGKGTSADTNTLIETAVNVGVAVATEGATEVEPLIVTASKKGIGTADSFGIPAFLSPRQDLHIPPVTDGRSVLTADPSELLQGLHSGEATILRQPKPGQVVVDFGKPIGEHWSNGVKVGETHFGSVSYGKKGAHIVPANPVQW